MLGAPVQNNFSTNHLNRTPSPVGAVCSASTGKIIMTNLRTKMKEEMILVGLAASTQAIYLKSVVNLHEYYKKSPAKLSEKEIRQYLLYLLQEKKLAPNTYNTHIYALRFFYCITLRKPLHKLELPTTKVIYKLPSILSLEEVQRIIKATSNIKHRALLMVIYGAGLRVSEALNLRMEDIDSERMTLHIRDCKNRKERYVIFSCHTSFGIRSRALRY
jgi:integrase/recombinase XerD